MLSIQKSNESTVHAWTTASISSPWRPGVIRISVRQVGRSLQAMKLMVIKHRDQDFPIDTIEVARWG